MKAQGCIAGLLGSLLLWCPWGLAGQPSALPTMPESISVPGPASEKPKAIPADDGTCCGDGIDCCCNGHLIGGASLYLVQPYYETNQAFTTFVQGLGPGQRVDARTNLAVAPSIWLGWMNECGLGGRVRWWYLREGTDLTATFEDLPGGPNISLITAGPMGVGVILSKLTPDTVASITTKLQMNVVDLEAIQGTGFCQWDLLFSGGLRMAHINQGYNAFVQPSSHGPVGYVLSGHDFDGVGPLVGLEARRPLGCNLALFGNLRSSLLYGSAKQSVAGQTFTDEGGLAGLRLESDHRNRVMFVQELELGTEYRTQVGGTEVFGQVALVGQNWFGAGNTSRTAPGQVPTGFQNSNTSVDTDLGFLGVMFRVGVNY